MNTTGRVEGRAPWQLADVRGLVVDPAYPSLVNERHSAAIAAEDELVVDALRRLGFAAPGPRAPEPQHVGLPYLVQSVSDAAQRPIHIPVGTQVSLGAGDGPWFVAATQSDDVRLVQWDATQGRMRTASRSWTSLLEHNPRLVPTTIDATGDVWQVIADEGSGPRGRATPIRLERERVGMPFGPVLEPHVATTTWDDVLRGTGIERRRPIASLPDSAEHAMNLRRALGETKFAVSVLGDSVSLRPRLVGTPELPGLGAELLRTASSTNEWFARQAGIPVWGAAHEAIFTVDAPSMRDNAAAGIINGRAMTFAGPSAAVRAAMSHDAGVAFDPDRPNDLERRARLLDANRVAVETHEAGHIAVAREWGPSRDRAMASRTPLAAVEGMVVDEAVSDLFAAARTDSPNLGVRTLDAMQPEWYSLETLRRSWVGVADPTSIDVHRGTQLLTKPMIHVLEHAGGDRLAEVTGAAVRAVGRSFADGSRTNVTIPEMATALLDATTNRFGPTSDVVGRVRDGWRALHVLR